MTFESDEMLLGHTRQNLGCDVRDPLPMQGLSKKQKELLKPRDRRRSEEERWIAVYKICFPDDETIPSPCKKLSSLYPRPMLTSTDYVYYSRETAELRREILDILREEIPQTQPINRDRLFQRVQNAFNVRSDASTQSSSERVLPSPVDDNVLPAEAAVNFHSSSFFDPLGFGEMYEEVFASVEVPQHENFEELEQTVDWNHLTAVGDTRPALKGGFEWGTDPSILLPDDVNLGGMPS